VTWYDCLHQGIPIPPQAVHDAVHDIDLALDYARNRGLFPHDVHGRNVMVSYGRGVVVDVSNFLNPAPCRAWEDVKRAYRWDLSAHCKTPRVTHSLGLAGRGALGVSALPPLVRYPWVVMYRPPPVAQAG
jgi:hypothetical protein